MSSQRWQRGAVETRGFSHGHPTTPDATPLTRTAWEGLLLTPEASLPVQPGLTPRAARHRQSYGVCLLATYPTAYQQAAFLKGEDRKETPPDGPFSPLKHLLSVILPPTSGSLPPGQSLGLNSLAWPSGPSWAGPNLPLQGHSATFSPNTLLTCRSLNPGILTLPDFAHTVPSADNVLPSSSTGQTLTPPSRSSLTSLLGSLTMLSLPHSQGRILAPFPTLSLSSRALPTFNHS